MVNKDLHMNLRGTTAIIVPLFKAL